MLSPELFWVNKLPDEHWEPSQKSKMELLQKIVNTLKLLTISPSYMFDRVLKIPLILHDDCPYSEFFWSVFSRIQTEYRDLPCKSPYTVQMQEKTDQKCSEYRQCQFHMTEISTFSRLNM